MYKGIKSSTSFAMTNKTFFIIPTMMYEKIPHLRSEGHMRNYL